MCILVQTLLSTLSNKKTKLSELEFARLRNFAVDFKISLCGNATLRTTFFLATKQKLFRWTALLLTLTKYAFSLAVSSKYNAFVRTMPASIFGAER